MRNFRVSGNAWFLGKPGRANLYQGELSVTSPSGILSIPFLSNSNRQQLTAPKFSVFMPEVPGLFNILGPSRCFRFRITAT